MDRNRKTIRQLEPADDYSRSPTDNVFRASTVDSGRGSIATADRGTTLDSRATNGTLSSLSRDTPINDHESTTRVESSDDKPIRIRPAPIIAKKCYEQAYVSHVDHPSAFFLQLAHSEKKYEELQSEINDFYSTTPQTDPSRLWKRGEYCIAKFNNDGFYRARIIETPQVTKTPNKYDVVFLDYGNWEKVHSINIHTILPKFAKLPAQAIPCSLTKTLPRSHSWSDHPDAIEIFKKLVLDKFVDATFSLKSNRDLWPLTFVDLQLSSNKLNVRDCMKDQNLIREVSNDQIYPVFHRFIKPVDCFIYSIPYEGEVDDDDDDY